MSENNQAEDVIFPIREIKHMKEEFKTITHSLDMEKQNNEALTKRITNVESIIRDLQKDLELESKRYGSDTTRKLARDAFNQSTASANWESLGDHPIIEGLRKKMSKEDIELQRQISVIIHRLENERPAGEVFEELRNHPIIIGIKSDIKRNQDSIEKLDHSIDAKAAQINKHDLKLRDKLSDIQQVQEVFEFKISEMNDMFRDGFLFAIGAFATLGHKPVSEGLQYITRVRKEEKPKDD